LHELDLYLRSGQIIHIQCEEWSFENDKVTEVFTGYDFKGLISPLTLGIVPTEIVAYVELA
jgi:hypothetical protein